MGLRCRRGSRDLLRTVCGPSRAPEATRRLNIHINCFFQQAGGWDTGSHAVATYLTILLRMPGGLDGPGARKPQLEKNVIRSLSSWAIRCLICFMEVFGCTAYSLHPVRHRT